MAECISVLYVEDDAVDQRAFARYVERQHLPYDCTIVGSVAEGRRASQEGQFDVAVVDYKLGDGTGMELIGGLKLPIIMITGSDNQQVAIDAMRAGAVDFVVKDSMGEYLKGLSATIERALHHHRTQLEVERYRLHLEELVAERTDELVRSNARLLEEIGQRERAEQELRVSEKQKAVILGSMREMLLYCTPELGVQWANTASRDFLGLEPDQLLGRSARDLLQPMLMGDVPAPGVPAGVTASSEEIVHRSDGQTWRIQRNPIIDQGSVTGEVLVVRDLTELLRLEEALLEARHMEALGRLAGGIAHDFNNLLTIICGYTALLLANLSPSDPSWSPLSEIHGAGERAAHLVSKMLALARRQMLRLSPLDLNPIIRGLEPEIERLAGPEVRVRLDLAADLNPVLFDREQLAEMLRQLVGNARDAMPTGGDLVIATASVSLSLEFAQAHPEVQAGAYVSLTVSDSGVGLSAQAREHLFEPFFTTKPVGAGTGLSLAAIRGTLLQCQGTIEVLSQLGRGTSVTLYLPVASRKAEVTAEEQAGRSSATLLVVDARSALRGLVRRVAERLGWRVREAADLADMLRRCANQGNEIDLILVDIPATIGVPVVSAVHERCPQARLAYLSDYGPEVLLMRGLVDASATVLVKPFDVSRLESLLSAYLPKPAPRDAADCPPC